MIRQINLSAQEAEHLKEIGDYFQQTSRSALRANRDAASLLYELVARYETEGNCYGASAFAWVERQEGSE